MRLVDVPRVECATEIAADPKRVWALVSDISTPARHSPELQEVEWLDGAEEPAVGACFSGRNHNDVLGEWRTVSRIAQFAEPRVFAWEVVRYNDRDLGGPLTIWTFTLEPLTDGAGTRLRHGMRLGPGRGPLNAFVERYPEREEQIVDGRLALLRTGIEKTLAGVKAEAES
ncbi:SRPBCC family protein [Streptomyces sp. SID4985]|uniref:SRPBCC family protein n=1 Tax=Streptomyces sp. SID4985 TaxID=2690292 RepID=UPI00136AE80D|nr:SRPBCC family protein [Streptomyces sp. SID4985]MYQ43796.1 SRPBCC family protein [Streptomyces sp. SID4985]